MRGATNKSINPERLAGLNVPILGNDSAEWTAVAELLQTAKKINLARQEANKLETAHVSMVEGLRVIGRSVEAIE